MTSKMSFDGPKNKDFIREQIDSRTNFAATSERLLQLSRIVAVSQTSVFLKLNIKGSVLLQNV